MEHLIIVESPTKVKTIKTFLSKDYTLIASKGHLRDLPKTRLGLKVNDKEIEVQYVVEGKDKQETAKQIKSLAAKAKNIYIATDEDREGEAIGYHIAQILKKDIQKLPRIVFHEITKKAITKALENSRLIDMNKVDAQQARRILDRIVGYSLSPLLSSKIQSGLSAGRVQSSTLKLIIDREKAINAFKPEEFWDIHADFDHGLAAVLYEYEGKKLKKFDLNNQEYVNTILVNLKSQNYQILKLEKKQKNTRPNPPFITSTLQQAASTELGFSPKKTMMIAQKLYEGVNTPIGVSGVITYMRTDSCHIAPEANTAIRDYILKHFTKAYLSPKTLIYTSKAKGAQEAHEAIRPVNIDFDPNIARGFLSGDELKLYVLIYSKFLASQMANAVHENQTLLIQSSNHDALFKSSGKRLIFDGFHKALKIKSNDYLLPELELGSKLTFSKMQGKQHFTEPPPRFNEASLIKEIEKLGIGRPSTYVPTISNLTARGYIENIKKQLVPQEIGFTVNTMLEEYFANIVDSKFTAEMENLLDAIAEGKKDWQQELLGFYEQFMAKIKDGKNNIKSQKEAKPLDENCPECKKQLLLRKGRFGEFIGCSGYPKCKYIRNTEANEKKVEVVDENCEKCNKAMVKKFGKNGAFLACSGYPKCKNTKPLESAQVTTLQVPCPKCQSPLLKRFSKRVTVFFGCSAYPKCDFISNFEPGKTKCPQCQYPMAERTFRKKEIFECVNKNCKHRMPNE